MKQKKQNALTVLLGYAGSHRRLTFLGLGLSAVSMVCSMIPYLCIWLAARDLIAVAPDWTQARSVTDYGWIAFAFAVGGILIYFLGLMCTHLAAFRTASNIRKQGMAHVMQAPLGYEIMTTKIGLFAIFGGTKMEITVKPDTGNGDDTPTTDVASAFTDISGHWAEEYIIRATNQGLFSGTSSTTFSPDTSMTAGMVITVLYRMVGSPATTLPDSMENVAVGSWYEIACAWGYNNGIIGGYKTFYPDQAVSRQEFATMLYNFYKLSKTPGSGADLSKYTDVSTVASWAKDAMAWANAAGIISGTSSTTLSPEVGASRSQIATMLCRYLDYAG